MAQMEYVNRSILGERSNLVRGDTTIKELSFWDFHEENPQVYKYFRKFAFQMIGLGHERLSSELLLNRVRWETMIQTTDEEFKINNNWRPYYSRLFMKEYNRLGFFETRTLVGEEYDYNELAE